MYTNIKNIRNLVFEGGGPLSVAYGGIVFILDKKLNILPQIERIAGTSSGSIASLILSLGYDAEEAINILLNLDFNKFGVIPDTKDSYKMLNELFFYAPRIYSKYGINDGQELIKWLGDVIEAKTGNRNLTFAQLHKLKEENPNKYKDLYVVACNKNISERKEIFSYESKKHKNLKITSAIRMSCGLPFVFESYVLSADDYVDENIIPDKDEYVDGAVVWNYPLKIFDCERYLSAEDKNSRYFINSQTLGFRLAIPQELSKNNEKHREDIDNIIDDLLSYFTSMKQGQNLGYLNHDVHKRTVYIDTFGLPFIRFNMPLKERYRLMISGLKCFLNLLLNSTLSDKTVVNKLRGTLIEFENLIKGQQKRSPNMLFKSNNNSAKAMKNEKKFNNTI